MTYRTHKKMAMHSLTARSLGLRTATREHPTDLAPVIGHENKAPVIIMEPSVDQMQGQKSRKKTRAKSRLRQGIRSAKPAKPAKKRRGR